MYYVRWNWQFSSSSTNQQILYRPWAITAVVILDHVSWQKPSEHLEFAVWPLPVLQDRLHWVFLCIVCCIKSGFFPCLSKIKKINLARLFWYLGAQMSFLKCCLDDRFTIHVICSDSCSFLKYKLQLVIQLQETPHYCPFRWACTMFG
jgi:hypothetical protein